MYDCGEMVLQLSKKAPRPEFSTARSHINIQSKRFNKAAVDHYLIDKYQLTAERIFNVDESDISTVQRRCQKVVGRRQK